MLTNRANEITKDIKSAANEVRAYPEVSEIRKDATDIRDNAASLLGKVRQDGAELASKVGHDIQDHAAEAYESMKTGARRQAEKVEARVIADPLKSVLIAAGVGFAVGFLTRR